MPFAVTLTALNSNGARVNYNGPVFLYTNASESAVNPTRVTLAQGVWSGSVTLNESAVGNDIQLRANSGSASGTSSAFTVTPQSGTTQPGALFVKVTSDRTDYYGRALPLSGAKVYLDGNSDGIGEVTIDHKSSRGGSVHQSRTGELQRMGHVSAQWWTSKGQRQATRLRGER